MWIVRFALRFPHTFYVMASLILFLGITTIVSMPTDIFPERDHGPKESSFSLMSVSTLRSPRLWPPPTRSGRSCRQESSLRS